VIYLTLPELVYIAERATGGKVAVREIGLLESASARPQATAFGVDAAYDLVMQIATGQLDSVSDITAILEKSTQPRP
jgi:death-on-curing protein